MNDNGGENADSSNLSSPTITVVPTPSPSTSSNAKSHSSSTTTNSNINNSNRMEQQMKKLKDANTKYKDLLKLAKERIQTQEEELTNLKSKIFGFMLFFYNMNTRIKLTILGFYYYRGIKTIQRRKEE